MAAPFGITRGADVFRVNSVAGAATLVAPNALVHGRRILGVTSTIPTAFGTTQGLTSIDIGGLGVQNGWGSNLAYRAIPLVLGTTTDQSDFGRGDQPVVPGLTDQDLIVSALGGLFDGVGQILLTVEWETLAPLLALLAAGLLIPQLLEIAGNIITSVRDKIPDPKYDDNGLPQPDLDGSYLRAQTLYRWLNNAIRRLTRRCNWTVDDWYALPVRAAVNSYALDARWQQVSDAWMSQFPLSFLNEAWTITPSYPQSAQPYGFGWHKRAGLLELMLFPAPNFADPVSTLQASLAVNDASILVTDTTGFLTFGWVQVDQELIEYKQLGLQGLAEGVSPAPIGFGHPYITASGIPVDPAPVGAAWPYVTTTGVPVVFAGPGNTFPLRTRPFGILSALRRGSSGSTILPHDATTPVQHCSFWVKGIRTPNPVKVSTDPLEVPLAFLEVLELYLLADVKEAQEDRAGAQSLRKEADMETEKIIRSPQWQTAPGGFQVRPYGETWGGGIYPYGPFGVLVP